MANLFDLPTTRNTKEADKYVVNKSTNKKSASTVIKGGGLIGRIADIKARVESKLGKYKDDYLYFMADDEKLLKEYIYNVKAQDLHLYLGDRLASRVLDGAKIQLRGKDKRVDDTVTSNFKDINV